jgi:peptidoglycan/LPS O-acetylase OafA/YrhL
MLDTLQAQVAVGFTLGVVAAAFLEGDEPERVGGAACALGLLASLLLQDRRLHGPSWQLLAVNGVMLVAYAALAWRSRRSWPVWASGLQGLIVMTIVASAADARPPPSAFHAVIDAAGYAILLTLALGVAGARRERRAASLGEYSYPGVESDDSPTDRGDPCPSRTHRSGRRSTASPVVRG